ncbi:protein LURP-one-related 5-like [Corylus avellana]|uniref:protein LURP-one-related 5-like n=1 Tax=Corylus avellana TaxID=13451 RepID=UPI001E1F217F|nr:protein LURP-one-related 5-like [Corylus avellana]
MKEGFVVEAGFVFQEETHLTVLKTSLFFADDGFTVYDCKGDLVLRVDSYGPGPEALDSGEIVLMDGNGRCLLTVRRKMTSLHQRWEGFIGERDSHQKPIFSVRRSSMIGRSTLSVEVFRDPEPCEEYQIEGNFSRRCCTIFNAEMELVGEIRRKVDASTHVVLGKDAFSLCIKPGFDGAFAMGLVLILDQINCDDYVTQVVQVEPVTDDSVTQGVPVEPVTDD